MSAVSFAAATVQKQGCVPPQDPAFTEAYPRGIVTGLWVRLVGVVAHVHVHTLYDGHVHAQGSGGGCGWCIS